MRTTSHHPKIISIFCAALTVIVVLFLVTSVAMAQESPVTPDESSAQIYLPSLQNTTPSSETTESPDTEVIQEEIEKPTQESDASQILATLTTQLAGQGSRIFVQGEHDLAATAEAGDHVGYSVATGDFNNDGYLDLAAGVPGEDSSGLDDVGVVLVLYGSPYGLSGHGSWSFAQGRDGVIGTIETGDQLGYALAVGDFNNDGYADLAAGAPGEDSDGVVDVGVVNVLYGSSAGLTGTDSQSFAQGRDGVAGTGETNDRMGTSLVTGDFNGDGYMDLAAGKPGENGNGVSNSGAVTILYGSNTGLNSTGSQSFAQGLADVIGTAEEGDRFGYVLASGDFNADGFADLASGAPGEDSDGLNNIGVVNIIYGSPTGLTGTDSQSIAQGRDGVAGSAETDDQFGYALAGGDFNGDDYIDLAIGVPLEDGSSNVDSGAVTILYGSAAGLSGTGSQIMQQGNNGVIGTVEAGDHVGYALNAGNFNGDEYADLAVGSPGEDSEGIVDVGVVNVLYGTSTGLAGAGSQSFAQARNGVAGIPKSDDQFGFAVASGDFNGDGNSDLGIGVPYDGHAPKENAGGVVMLYAYAPPIIQLSASQLTFNVVEGQVDLTDQLFLINNGNNAHILGWRAETNVPWLNLVYTNSTVVPISVTASVNISGLLPGAYDGQITISGINPGVESKSIAVKLNISDGDAPLLQVAPSQLSFAVIGGVPAPASHQFAIRNLGAGTLNWNATVITGSHWLEIVGATSGGTNNTGTTVSIRPKDLAALPPGLHMGQIMIQSPDVQGSPQVVDVTLEVVPPPALAVSPRQRIFNALYENGNPPVQTILVANSGGEPLNWSATVKEQNGNGWLHIDKNSGTSPGQIAVSVDTQNLSLGQIYRGQIEITSPGAQGSPKVVEITLKYSSNLRMRLTSDTLSFYAVINQATPGAQDLVVLRSTGTMRSFNWQASSDQPWLKVDKTSGNATTNVTLKVSALPGNLTVGRYQGKIRFDGEVAQGLPSTVPVELVVAEREVAPRCQQIDQTIVDRTTAELKLEGIVASPNTDGSCTISGDLVIELPQNKALRVQIQGTINTQNQLNAAILDNKSVSIDVAGVELVLKNIKLNNSGLEADANWKLGSLSSAQPGAGKVRIDSKGLTFAGSQAFTFKPALKVAVQGFSATIQEATLGVDSRADSFTLNLEGTVAISVKNGPGVSAGVVITLNRRGIRQTKVSAFKLEGVAGIDLSVRGAQVTSKGVLAAEATLKVPKQWGGATVTVTGLRVTKDGKITLGGGSFELPGIKAGDGFTLSALKGSFTTDSRGRYIISADGRFALPVGKGNGSCTLEVGVTLRAGSGSSTILQIASVEPDAADSLVLNRISLGLWDCPITSAIPIGSTGFYLTGVRGTVILNSGVESVSVDIQVRTALEFGSVPAIYAEAGATINTRPPSLELRAVVYALGLKASQTRVFISKATGFSATLTFDYVIFHASLEVNAWKHQGATYITGNGIASVVLKAGTFGEACVKPLGCVRLPPGDVAGPVVESQFGTFTNGSFGIKGTFEYKFEKWGKTLINFRGGFFVDGHGNVSFGNVDQYQLVTRPQIQALKSIYAARAQGEAVTASSELDGEVTMGADGSLFVQVPVGAPISTADAVEPYTVTQQSDLLFALTQPLTGTLTFALIDPEGNEISQDNLPANVAYQSDDSTGQIQDSFAVAMATPGTWQMYIGGDTDHTDFVALVLGNVPAPFLSGVGLVPTANPDQVNVNWRVQSRAEEVTVSIYANPGPLTRTITITQPDGTVTAEVLDVFIGVPLLTGQETTINGSNNQKQVDLSSLPTGVYHLWIEVDDSRNPPVRSRIATVNVNHSNSFPAGAVAATAPAGGVVAASWETPLTTIEDMGNGELLLQWTPYPHPDVDTYRVRVRSLDDLEPTVEIIEETVVGDVSESIISVGSGQTYWIAIGAEDIDTDRVAWSQETEITTSQADFTVDLAPGVMTASGVMLEVDALLTGEEDAIPIRAGQQMTIPLQIQLPEGQQVVVLSVDYEQLSGGIDVTLGEDLVVTSGAVDIGVAVMAEHPGGFYSVPILATSGTLVRTLTLVVDVESQDGEQPKSPVIYLPLINFTN